jgi:cell division transport system permease protein
MFNRIEFVFSEAMTALSRNRLMALAAVTTVAVSLFLFGGMGYAYYRLNSFAKTIPGKFNMLVYLRDEATRKDVLEVAAQMRSIPGVGTVSWIPKDKAWERWKLEHPTALTEGVENPLPDGFKVVLTDLKLSDSVVDSIKAIPIVAPEGVMYLKQEQRVVEGLLTSLRVVGSVVGGILFIIAGILIYNAIRLTVLSRRLEIRIMQLVGASRGTVYVPFLIEGMIQGVVGAVVATGLVIGAYSGFTFVMKSMVNFSYTPAAFPYVEVLVILAAAGALYGTFCSVLAIRAPLKYR